MESVSAPPSSEDVEGETQTTNAFKSEGVSHVPNSIGSSEGQIVVPRSSAKRSRMAAGHSDQSEIRDIAEATLDRLTRGIPKRELRLCIRESLECEEALRRDIEALEKALEKRDDSATTAAVDEMLQSPFTPLDRYWTASALIGRLRGPMAPPSLFKSRDVVPRQKGTPKPPVPTGATWSLDAQRLLDLLKHPAYRRTEQMPTLLACWKKIFSNRAALVFKKPVRDEEAPGYSERIDFPMDLSMVRKMIVTRHIDNFEQLHFYIALIAHNCVKYNGRETDYGMVAQEFEALADEVIRQAVLNASATKEISGPSNTTSTTTTTVPDVAATTATIPASSAGATPPESA